jgi:glycosyltransferase involved in cell wall biosynthesis
LGRNYQIVSGDSKAKPRKVYLLMIVYNCDDYLGYCLDSLKNQVDGYYILDNGSTDNTHEILSERDINYRIYKKRGNLSQTMNELLKDVPPNRWLFYVDSDEVLQDLPDGYLGRYAKFLESQKCSCSDVRTIDFIYNYGTLNAAYDWGFGPGYYWVARKLFYYTGKEKFLHKYHFNVCNLSDEERNMYMTYVASKQHHLLPEEYLNNEHTGEWKGKVFKNDWIRLFHYGNCRGIERLRKKKAGLLGSGYVAFGAIATKPFLGKHPSVMNL